MKRCNEACYIVCDSLQASRTLNAAQHCIGRCSRQSFNSVPDRNILLALSLRVRTRDLIYFAPDWKTIYRASASSSLHNVSVELLFRHVLQ